MMKVIIVLFLFISLPTLAINTVDTGFQLNSNELKTIVAHGVCKKVWNTSAASHFVSTKSSMEWTNFYVNHPSDLVVRDCFATCSNLKKMGITTSGVYSLDVDGAGPLASMNMYCDMDSEGGGWTRIFRQDKNVGYFATTAAALSANTTDPTHGMYSILNLIDSFESNHFFTFRIFWPTLNKRNVWAQQTNPTYDTDVRGKRDIALDSGSNRWGGLELGNRTNGVTNLSRSLLDGSVSHPDWWFAIGATFDYNGGIPSTSLYQSTGVAEVELYIHDGGLYPMSCQHILELGESKGSGVYTIYPDQINAVDVYCDMDIEGGGWTLFYANAADASMSVKKSYNEYLATLSGVNLGASGISDIQTAGMLNYKDIRANEIMARDVGNWSVSEFSLLSFGHNDSLEGFIDGSIVRPDDTCHTMQNGDQFIFRNSNAMNYYFGQLRSSGQNMGFGNCSASFDQTGDADVENYPRDWIYHKDSNVDSSRVRGIGGFNSGSATAKGRYYIRENYSKPKSCMDILLNGESKGSGTYTIYPKGTAVSVDCDMTTQGGGWTKVWHGYPTRAITGDTSLEVYSKSNSIAFNQMRVEGVNINVNIVDSTWTTAYLNKTIPEYFQQVAALPDASNNRVSFADFDGGETVGLVGNYFFNSYGNYWRVFYPCINVDSTSADRVYVSGGYNPTCPAINNFNQASISTCTSTGNNYCTDAINSTEVDSGLGLTLKQYQETRVWVRNIPSMRSCREYLDRGFSSGNGTYLIDPDGPSGSTLPFPTFCDMTTDNGGWTLVWGNTRGGTNKPFTNLTYANSIATRPRCSTANGSVADTSGNCSFLYQNSLSVTNTVVSWLEKFNYYVGLKHWDDMTGGSDFQLLYKWSADYGRSVDQEAIMEVENFDPAQNYQLKIFSSKNIAGSVAPSMSTFYSSTPWSATDADNDTSASSCAQMMESPYWFLACWSGSLVGGGENSYGGYYNGAYWRSSVKQWADPVTADGAGNGWFFIRENKTYGNYKASCKEILDENPNSVDGYYTIDQTPGSYSDSNVVYCDMTGGGWTRVLSPDGTTTQSQLSYFGTFSGTVALAYNATYGYHWQGSGPTMTDNNKLTFDKFKNWSEIKIKGYYANNIDATVGYTSLKGGNFNYFEFRDAHQLTGNAHPLYLCNVSSNKTTTGAQTALYTCPRNSGEALIWVNDKYDGYTRSNIGILELWLK